MISQELGLQINFGYLAVQALEEEQLGETRKELLRPEEALERGSKGSFEEDLDFRAGALRRDALRETGAACGESMREHPKTGRIACFLFL